MTPHAVSLGILGLQVQRLGGIVWFVCGDFAVFFFLFFCQQSISPSGKFNALVSCNE